MSFSQIHNLPVFSPTPNAQFALEVEKPRALISRSGFFTIQTSGNETSPVHFSVSGKRVHICLPESQSQEDGSVRGINVSFKVGSGQCIKSLQIEPVTIVPGDMKTLEELAADSKNSILLETLAVLQFLREHFRHYFVSETWDLRLRQAESIRGQIQAGKVPNISVDEGLLFLRNVIAHWGAVRDLPLIYSVPEPDWSELQLNVSPFGEVTTNAPPKNVHFFSHPAKSLLNDSDDPSYFPQAAIGPDVTEAVNTANFDCILSHLTKAPPPRPKPELDQLVLSLFPPQEESFAAPTNFSVAALAEYGIEQFRVPEDLRLLDFEETDPRCLSTFGILDRSLRFSQSVQQGIVSREEFDRALPEFTAELTRRILDWEIRPEILARVLFLSPEESQDWAKVRQAAIERLSQNEMLAASVLGQITSAKKTAAKYELITALETAEIEPTSIMLRHGTPGLKYTFTEELLGNLDIRDLLSELKRDPDAIELIVGRKGTGQGVLNTTTCPKYHYTPWILKIRKTKTEVGVGYQVLTAVELKAPDSSGILILGKGSSKGSSDSSRLSAVRQSYVDLIVKLSSSVGIETVPYAVEQPLSTMDKTWELLDMDKRMNGVKGLLAEFNLPDPLITWNHHGKREFIGAVKVDPCEAFPEGLVFETKSSNPRRAIREAIEKLRKQLNQKKMQLEKDQQQPRLPLDEPE